MRNMKHMTYVIGIKVRIFPSTVQKRIIAKNDGVTRFIYNRLVARDRELHSLQKVQIYCEPVASRIDYLKSLGTDLSDFKAAYPFLEDPEIDSLAIANAKQNYLAAWKNFRKVPGTSMPVFHKKWYGKSYQTNRQYASGVTRMDKGSVRLLDDRHLKIPKLGSVKFAGSGMLQKIFKRTCETRIGTVTVSMDNCGDYYVSLQAGSVCPFHKTLPDTGDGVGIDVNIKNLYTDSNGQEADNPKFYTKGQKKLAKAQKKLARRKERAIKEGRSIYESKNYQKQRLKVARLCRTIARRREDYLDVQSKHLVESQDYIFAEDIKTKNLLKNHKLAKVIADVAWGMFLSKVSYKCDFYGRLFGKVPPKSTTQMCSNCGHVMKGIEHLDLDTREWTCPECGTHHNRDKNSAINIKNLGKMIYLPETV